jgi:hypothetical protein
MTQETPAGNGNDALGRLLARLPVQVEPPHDLWPGIAAAISAPAQASRAHLWTMRIAAGLACVAVGVGLGYSMLRPRGAPPGEEFPVVADAVNSWLVKPVMLDAGYQKARMQLASQFVRRISDLPANDRARVQKGLRQIEDGLRDLNDALKSQPDSVLLQQLVLGAYQQELEYMQNVASLTQTVSESTQT